jgi:hypothetical protein
VLEVVNVVDTATDEEVIEEYVRVPHVKLAPAGSSRRATELVTSKHPATIFAT